jgi:hypothetical protein
VSIYIHDLKTINAETPDLKLETWNLKLVY